MDITYFWPFDAKFLGLTIDTFGRSTLPINGLVERAGSVKHDSYDPTSLPIRVLLTSYAFEKLGVIAGFSCGVRVQKGTGKALSAISIGVIKLLSGIHAQAFLANRNCICVTT
jgi:hypothetical protein